jgi:hypothetical protein
MPAHRPDGDLRLNERGVQPARGTRWHLSPVLNLLARAQKLADVRGNAVAI